MTSFLRDMLDGFGTALFWCAVAAALMVLG